MLMRFCGLPFADRFSAKKTNLAGTKFSPKDAENGADSMHIK
jgi:hypothetical protein